MSLGIIKRVALWRQNRQINVIKNHIEKLLQGDVSDPTHPLAIATFWRDIGVSVFTDIPMEKQISYELERFHTNLGDVAVILDKTLQLIVEDDYEHAIHYLSRHLKERHSTPVSVYLTDKKGIPIDTEATYIRISTLLYSLAAALDGMESFEYHRVVNPLYRELLNVIAQLLEIKQR